MKKIGIILAIIAIVAFAGCGSGGGGKSSGDGAAPLIVDLNTLTAVSTLQGDKVGNPTGQHVRNVTPFAKNYDDLLLLFAPFTADVSQYQRVTIKCKYFNADNEEIGQGDSNAMVSFIYDLDGDWRGPAMGPGANTPLKEMNVGGFSGLVSGNRGIRVRLSQWPSAVLFQNSNAGVKFIEVTAIVFHNGNYDPAE